jgi:RsiW-degrading membrane proteinase PrsW (M82 family)
MDIVLIKIAVALAPVLAFIVLFVLLDAFKLMSRREVLTLLAAGGGLAGAAYGLNAEVMDALPIGFSLYSRFASPVLEECLKGAVIVWLFARNRIGFRIDAAISGFVVGAGFSLIENVFYLYHFSGANLGVWLVRGFGTAVMHGGATALFAVVSQFLMERELKIDASRWRLHPLLFVPGLLAAILVHGLYNQFPDQPLLAMGVTLLAAPLTVLLIFARSANAAHKWLIADYETHEHMLADLRSGAFAASEDGRVIAALAARLPPKVADDVFDYIRLHTELVTLAEAALLARQNGEAAPGGPKLRAMFQRLHALEKAIGRTALMTINPHLHFSRNDLWEMHELEEDAMAGRG